MYHGWLVIDKPLGRSSAQIVGKVKWLMGLKKLKLKIGHAGTLDPLASGILPLAIGECTKVVRFLSEASKTYEFEVTWGEESSTDDAEGEAVETSAMRPTREQIEAAMQNFAGEIEQVPPQYSAIKIDGKRAYDLARDGKVADIKTRKITIHKLEIIEENHSPERSQSASAPARSGEKSTKFRAYVSKGTYIRSIARDMGRELGCYGFISALRRTTHGQFTLEGAISLEQLEEMCEKGSEQQAILPVDDVLDDIPELKLSDEEAQRIRNGIVINVSQSDAENIRLYHNNTLLAIAEISNGILKTHRVFNL